MKKKKNKKKRSTPVQGQKPQYSLEKIKLNNGIVHSAWTNNISSRTIQWLESRGYLANIFVGIAYVLISPFINDYINGRGKALGLGVGLTIFIAIFAFPSIKTRRTIISTSVILMLLWAAAYWQYQNIPPTNMVLPKPVLPTFRETKEKLIVEIGPQPFIIGAKDLKDEGGYLVPIEVGGYVPFKLSYKEGKLYVNAAILNEINLEQKKPAIEITQNEFLIRGHGWSYNLSDKAFEVVDERERPRLQIIYQSDSRILIYGVFPYPDGVNIFCANRNGLVTKSAHDFTCNLRPLFKYPSWKYPGLYNE